MTNRFFNNTADLVDGFRARASEVEANLTAVDGGFTLAQAEIDALSALIALRATLASPAFTGVPTGPTASIGTNSAQLATTAYVIAAALAASLPGISGNTNKWITNDGSTIFWSNLLLGLTEARATAAISAGALALNLTNAVTAVSLNANVTSLTLSNNIASASVVQSHTLEFTADGTARTVVWPAGDGTTTLLFKWPNGVAPTLTSTSGKVDSFFFKSRTQFLWDAYVVGQNS